MSGLPPVRGAGPVTMDGPTGLSAGRESRGRAPGKVILMGEHAVVYGHRAIAAALDLHLEVTLRTRPGPTALARAMDEGDLVTRALRRVLPARGIEVGVSSQIPIGRGMGSSAALSVALVRARAALMGERLERQALLLEALAIETVFHGRPSGMDTTVVALGGMLAFRRGPPPIHDTLHPATPIPLVVLDSGRSASTARMVEQVASMGPGKESIMADIGALVEQATRSLSLPETLGGLLDRNHLLLRELGVSTPELDHLVDLAKRNGALGAKLSGSGGGGVVVALAPGDARSRIAAAARAEGFRAWQVDAGDGSRS